MRPKYNLPPAGTKFHRLTSLGTFEMRRSLRHVHCICECGNHTTVAIDRLYTGHTKSCGCAQRDAVIERNKNSRHEVHGMARTSIYQTWANMVQRCENPKHPQFSMYGGRGITICDEWHAFPAFYRDMGDPPTARHSLDRIDNSAGYEPGNCRWATSRQQSRNIRTNHNLTHDGQTRCLAEWGEILGINPGTIRSRLRAGWSVAEALTTPVNRSANISRMKRRHADSR